VSAFARNHYKSEEEAFAILNVGLKKARAFLGPAVFDAVLSSAPIKRGSSPRSGAQRTTGPIPRAPSVSEQVFPPNDEVDAYHMRTRQRLQEWKGKVVHMEYQWCREG